MDATIPHPSKKSLRQRQLRVGQVVLNYYPSSKKGDETVGKEAQRGRGRPSKPDELKVKTISFKAPRSLIHFLEKVRLPHRKAQGKGGKIRYMIIKYLIYRDRERAQLRLIRRALGRMREDLKKYMAVYQGNENPHLTQELLNKLEKSVQQARVVMHFYKIPIKDLSRLLPAYDKDLHFVWDWNRQKGVHHA